jgi:hypothetical protein
MIFEAVQTPELESLVPLCYVWQVAKTLLSTTPCVMLMNRYMIYQQDAIGL